jgi:hypothetical protein
VQLGLKKILSPPPYLIEHPRGHVHDAQGMLEAGVHRTGIDHVRQAELAYAAQALEKAVVDDVQFPFVQRDEPVDWIAYLVELSHGGPAWRAVCPADAT